MPSRAAISPIGFILAWRAISISVAMGRPRSRACDAVFSQSRKFRNHEFVSSPYNLAGAMLKPFLQRALTGRWGYVSGCALCRESGQSRFALRSRSGGSVDPFSAALLIVALAAGLALGWFLGSRPVADWRARHAERDAAAKEHEAQFKQAVAELGQARIEIATLTANAENFDKQIAQLNQAREDLIAQFKAAGGEVLSKAQEEFLKTAAERFGHAEAANKEAVKSLLEPVHQRLRAYEEQITSLERNRVNAFGELTGLIASMREGQEQVRREAQRLGNSLTNAPKARGRWGEQQLRNVLEQCGLSPHTDFSMEHSIETEDGRLRPDAIVRIPGGKVLVIDAKVSLNAYQAAFEADSDESRALALADHVRSMR